MTRADVWRRLSIAWWWQLVLALAPLFVVYGFSGYFEPLFPVLAMPLFVAGLLSMFVSLKTFGLFKRSLLSTAAAFDTPAEPAAWIALAANRRVGFLAAGLPAWVAALGVLFGLEVLPLGLLALSSVLLMLLYRIPRQLRR